MSCCWYMSMYIHLCVHGRHIYVCISHLLHVNTGVLLIENESHQTALAMVEEEDQFADCLELVSVTSLFVIFLHFQLI